MGEHLQEWLILATAPAGDTKASAVLSVERTPGLYNIYIDMLFIGLSDNTRLESYVSLYKTFCHVNMKATTVEQMFLYHAGLEAERLQLRTPEMRSTNGGARRPAALARADKPVHGHHAGSKKQQKELCRLALVRANGIDRKRYFQRGPLSLVQLHWEEQQRQQRFRRSAADKKLKRNLKSGRRMSEKQLRAAAAPKAVPPLKKQRTAPQRAAAASAERSMERQLADAAVAEQEAAEQEAARQAAAEAAAQRLEVMRQETARALAEHSQRVAAEAAAAEAARAAAAAARAQTAERARERDLREMKAKWKAFVAEFTREHGRAPVRADLESARYVRFKVLSERYQYLKNGIVSRSLQGGRDRTRDDQRLQHRW